MALMTGLIKSITMHSTTLQQLHIKYRKQYLTSVKEYIKQGFDETNILLKIMSWDAGFSENQAKELIYEAKNEN